jgi:exosome complex component RRP40
MSAALPLANFEGTTRKNKPNLSVGSVVFARVLVANKDLEPELICMDENGKGEGYGEVKEGGMLSRCSVSYSQRLQRASCPILDALAKHFAFEIVAGANGRFVVNGAAVGDTIALRKAILAAEGLDQSQIPALIRETMTNKQP